MSILSLDPVAASLPRRHGFFRFRVRDIAETLELEVSDIPRGTSTSEVAQAMALRMELPGEIAYALRDERSGQWLKDDLALDSQLNDNTDVSLRLTPKARLG
jgi:hypothetical protein